MDQNLADIVYFFPIGHEAHYESGHPERPDRIGAIVAALENIGCWSEYPHLEPMEIPSDVLTTVHARRYLQLLEEACRQGQHLDADTYTTPSSWRLSLNAAGGAIACSVAVWTGHAKRCFALTRPPGHHATHARGMGFCLLNNVAMAAEYLIQHEGATRLAIIDLDLHHGNGTQDIFYERRDVLYCSIHQAPLYPGTGMLADIGVGEGRGTTVNIPLPPGSGDLAYEQVTSLIFLPILQRYQPEMILISFGFDPHWLDPLGHMMITADGYARIIHNLAVWADSHCNGRVGLYLEGGYDLDAGAACSQAVIQALLGKKWKDLIGPPHHPQGKSWRTVLQQAMDIWNLYDVE